MYSNIEEAWKVSNDLDKYRKDFKPITSVADATNEININSSKSGRVLENKSASPVIDNLSTVLSEVSDISLVQRKINKTIQNPKQHPKQKKYQKPIKKPVQKKSVQKPVKEPFKNNKKKTKQPNVRLTNMNNKKNRVLLTKSINSSSHSHFDFETDLRDLVGSIKKDDGKQCNKLFSHFQVCKKCRNTLIEKFSLNTAPAIKGLTEAGSQNSLILYSLKFNLTESFIDLSKYTDLLKDKNNKNIVSIVLFGLLVIIILYMTCK
jgi:hypothetical protein